MSDVRTEISELGEFGLIDHLNQNVILRNPSTIKGIGDDAAVIEAGDHVKVVTTDLLLEGVHFDLSYAPLTHVGFKAVAVNVSDIAAMNAIPTQITMSVAISNRFSLEALEEFYEGVYTACNDYGVDLVGGDTSTSQKGLIISVTAIGEVAPDKFVKRSTANKGDLICVSGDLGAAFLGLTIMEREKRIFLESPDVKPDFENEKYLIGRMLKPQARKDVIEFFAEAGIVPTAMIDVSDGLSSDLLHICKQSELGCVLYEEKIPIGEETRQAAFRLNELDPTMCALNGGEDYELLFTIQPDEFEKLTPYADIHIIGYMTDAEQKAMLHTKGGNKVPITAQGWSHLK